MKIRTQEAFNYYSHMAGGIAAIVGTFYLTKETWHSASMLITSLIYGLSCVFLFTASALYHRFKTKENEVSIWRRMDRLAIFFMIAGTCTPICYFCMEGYWRWSMIGIQWGLVGFGVISQLLFPKAPRAFYALTYILMGWVTILPIKQILANMTLSQEILLWTGGAAFTMGGLIYSIKRPRLVPGIFSFHELFHILILIGGVLHYAMIYRVYFEIATHA